MNNVIDLSAKLLANEDVSVQRARTKTASFDIKSRVLTLPLWQDMTPEIEQMLVGHEVGHALYTTDQYAEPMKENPSIRSYMNVLEDVRIEKLMKRKYPGIRKHMAAGYKQLNDRDFFDIEGKDVNSMLLIDKINLYFKAGLFNLDFTPQEKQFVVRAERTETIDDVISLAQEVWAYSKEEYEKNMEEMEDSNEGYQFDEEEDDFDFDEDGDSYEMPMDEGEDGDDDSMDMPTAGSNDGEDSDDEDGQTTSAGTEQGDHDPMESQTQRAFNDKLEELADTETEVKYWEFDSIDDDVVVPFKKILQELPEDLEERRVGYDEQNKIVRENFIKFKSESTKTVNYLVKEFEMRKSATLYKRAQSSKTGSLDMKKIYGYKINDDLFKRVTMIPEGKNHGMIILVDWSGSMQNVINETIQQVVNLAMFCQRINIPYRVFAFSSQYYDRNIPREDRRARRDKLWNRVSEMRDQGKNVMYQRDDFHMLEFFNDKMTGSEFWKMAEMLLDWRVLYCRRYTLGGTPLNEGLLWTYQNIGKFIKSNNVEKMTFITLTDGEGGALDATTTMRSHIIKEYGHYDTVNEVQIPNTYTTYRHLMQDPVTKKTYRFTDDANVQTRNLIKMIKDRHQVNTVGFYICQNSKRDLYWAVRSNSKNSGSEYATMEKMKRAFREQGFYSLEGAGRDEMFIIPKNKMKIQDNELTASGEMTARKLASQFGKYLNQKKTSRVLLNRFIGWVA
jgi:hypothetical protein